MRNFTKLALTGVLILSLSIIYSLYSKKDATPVLTDKTSSATTENISAEQTSASNETEKNLRASENYGKLPLHFEPNQGQTVEDVKFFARGRGYGIFLENNSATLILQENKDPKRKEKPRTAVLKMNLLDAQESESLGEDELTSKTNYFIGNDPNSWRTNVQNFGKVRFQKVYEGIDVVYYGNQRRLEYDFIVAPQADAGQIKLNFEGAKKVRIDENSGDLLLDTALGTVRQHKPFAYQIVDGAQREIAAVYAFDDSKSKDTTVSIKLADYDRSKELVVDPILAYASYLGGTSSDYGTDITVDATGNTFVTGYTVSTNFPTTPGALKTTLLPVASSVYDFDAFVSKINASGTALVYSTYLGSNAGGESAYGIAVDADGNAYIAGSTTSADFPIVNAQQPTPGQLSDAFLSKLNATGSALLFSTFYGGNGSDSAGKVRLVNGELFITGDSRSSDFPTTAGVLKPASCTGAGCQPLLQSESFLMKFTTGGGRVWATLLGGSSAEFTSGLAVDQNNNSHVVGYTLSTDFPTTSGAFQTSNSGNTDGFLAKVNADGTALIYATYLGGGIHTDRIWDVDIDAQGRAVVAGQTENVNFPTTAGAFDTVWNNSADPFLTKFNLEGTALVYSTFFGGNGADKAFAVKLASNGEPIIAGETSSVLNNTFPLRNSLQGTLGTMFIARFNDTATDIRYSSLIGTGGAKSLALDADDNAYLTGEAHFVPTTAGAPQTMRGNPSSASTPDGFVMKIAPTDETANVYAISGTVTDSTFSNDQGPVIVSIAGTVNRSVVLPYSGNGSLQYSFGGLPAGGNYTVSASKVGFLITPENAVFNNLQANQFADFAVQPNGQPIGVVTSPTHQQTFNAPATVNIAATASDPDGHAIQKVDFVAYHSVLGSIPLGTDTTAPYEFTWTNVPVGTYAIYAIPTDGLGRRGVSTPTVHIFVIDTTAPSIQITSPLDGQTFTEGDFVPLGAQVSSSIVVVEWRDQNNTLIGRRTSAPWTTEWRVMTTGNYTITATGITAQNQQVTSQPVNITVNPINHRISGRIRDSITGQGVANVALGLTSPTNPNITATVTTDANGDYLFTNLGTTPNDGVVITPTLSGYRFEPSSRNIPFLGYIERTNEHYIAVRETPITVEMTSPVNGDIFTAPATINFAATASSGAGAITRVEFYRQSGTTILLGADTTAPFEFQLTGVAPGSYTYFVRAFDANGNAEDSATAIVTVSQASSTVRIVGYITNPGGGWMPGITVRLTGTFNGNPISQTSATNTFGVYGFFNLPSGGSYTVTPQPAGTMTFTPISRSYPNLVFEEVDADFVSSEMNQFPTVTLASPTDGATFNLPGPVPISATASDVDGTITHFRLTAVGNSFSQTIGQSNNGTLSFNWTPTLPGAYTLYATATDNGGFQTTSSVNITVTNNTPATISGRIVDRNSTGIEGVTLELKNSPETTVIATATTDANGNYTISNVATFQTYVLRASKLNYTFSPQKRTYFNLSVNQTNADYTGTLQVQPSEFDGDGISDVAVWRPSNGVWYVNQSSDGSATAIPFGGANFGDLAVPGNYDGDRKTDYAVYRNGVWYIRHSSDGQVKVISFGIAGDKPVAGDYDGDGKTDPAVWRGSTGVWHILRSSNGGYEANQFGLTGDTPLVADFDGDGKADRAVWRGSTGVWYVLKSSDNAALAYQFGTIGDIPLVGDFDGDKLCDYTIFRPSTGVWYVNLSATNDFKIQAWGISTDIPVPGDFDRDGKTDIGIFRPSEGNWYVLKSSTGGYTIQRFGLEGDMPVPAAY